MDFPTSRFLDLQTSKFENSRSTTATTTPPYKHNSNAKFDPDRETSDKIAQVKQIYEMRIRSLNENFKQLFNLVSNDQLLNMMKRDNSSMEFANQRVKEIIEDFLHSEREYTIEKIATQYSLLTSEYQKLHTELIRIETSTRDASAELERRCIELEDALKKENKEKEFFSSEAESLRQKLKEMSDTFESNFKRKEAQFKQRSERDATELHALKQRMIEFETERTRRENQIYELTSDNITLKQQIEADGALLQKLDAEINTLRKNICELDSANLELKGKNQSQNELISNLKAECDKKDKSNKELTASLAAKEEEFKNLVAGDHEAFKQALVQVKEKYKNKIKQYKAKLVDYKNKLADREQGLQDMKKKLVEHSSLQEKSDEAYRIKMEELKKSYEQKLILQEEDFRRQNKELMRSTETQIAELQLQFQNLLDSRIADYKEEAQEQIVALRKTEKNLHSIIEDKIRQMDRECVRLTTHEDKMREKDALIEKMKTLFKQKETELKEEAATKLKLLEERKAKEIEQLENNSKTMIAQLENQIQLLNNEKRNLQNELQVVIESNQSLTVMVDDLENQRVKFIESLERLELKGADLRKMYEKEINRRKELENELQAATMDLHDMREAFDESKVAITARNENLKNLAEENNNLKQEIMKEVQRSKLLQRELEGLKLDRNYAENKSTDTIQSLKEQNQGLQKENRELTEKILTAIKRENERYEAEVSQHFETKSQLKLMEMKLNEKVLELSNSEGQVEKLKVSVQKLESNQEGFQKKLDGLEAEKQNLLREIQSMASINEQLKFKSRELKQKIQQVITSRLKGMKRELDELKEHNQISSGEFVKEMAYKLESFMTLAKEQVLRKEIQSQNIIQSEKDKLTEDFSEKLSALRATFESEQQAVVLALEKKLQAKENEINELKNESSSLRNEAAAVVKEIHKGESRVAELEKIIASLKEQMSMITREKDGLKRKLEAVEASHNDEIEELNARITKAKAEYENQRKELATEHTEEVRDLKQNISTLQEKLQKTVLRHEEHVKNLETAHKDELTSLRAKYDEKLERLNSNLELFNTMDNKKADNVRKLQETISQLEKEKMLQEQDKNLLRRNFEAKLDQYHAKIEELKLNIQIEAENSQRLRIEKTEEIERLNADIQQLQDEVEELTKKVNGLTRERNEAQARVRDLQRELDQIVNENDNYKKDLIQRQVSQTKEIENLHKIIAQTYRESTFGGNDSSTELLETDSQLPQTVQGLKKIDQYLDSKATTMKAKHRSPSKSSHRSPLKTARKSPGRSVQRSPSKSTHRSPLKSARRNHSPARSTHRSPAKSTQRSPLKSIIMAGQSPLKGRGSVRSPSKSRGSHRSPLKDSKKYHTKENKEVPDFKIFKSSTLSQRY